MALIATVRSGEAIPSALGSNPQARHRAPGSPVSPPGRPTPPISSLATAAAGKWKILDTTHILWGTNRTRWASSSPDQAADVAEGPAVGPGERPYRPVGRVAHTDQVDGGVAVGESQDPLSPLWLMTAEWPEPMPRPAAASSIMFAVAWPKSYISQSRCRSSSGSLATRAIGAADWRCASGLGPRLSSARSAARGPLRPRNSRAASFPRMVRAVPLKDAGRCTGVGCGARMGSHVFMS